MERESLNIDFEDFDEDLLALMIFYRSQFEELLAWINWHHKRA